MWCAKIVPFLGNKPWKISYSSLRFRPCNTGKSLDCVILSLIFAGNKAVDHNKCDSCKAHESLSTIGDYIDGGLNLMYF